MKKKLIISLFLAIFLINFPFAAEPVFAEEITRDSQKYDESRFELMTYADDKWYQWAQKTGTAAVAGIKNFLWNINIIISNITLMIIYQLFSLDIIELTKDSIMEITSGTAGSLMANLGMFALAVASLGVVIRAYIQQNWQAFFKIVSMVVISMALLFSIQSKNFNFVDLAHGVSVSLENAVIKVNPSLTESTTYEMDENIGNQVSVEVENKAYQSLVFKPYLLLQYGSTNVDEINEAGSYNGEETRINEYLNANPMTSDGSELREKIAEHEYTELTNENVFAGNAFKTSAYIMGVIISTSIQAVVFFFLALMRIMLQFAFVFLLILLPFMLFMSLFPSFEGLVTQYIKGTFMVIVFKAMAVFFVLVATSFITLSYEMADLSNDIYYRIFIQSIFSIAIIFMYMKRQFVMDMINGAAPSLASMGAGEGMARKMTSGFSQRRSLQKAVTKGNNGKIAKRGINSAASAAAKNSGKKNKIGNIDPKNKSNKDVTGRKSQNNKENAIGSKIKGMKDHVKQVQNGEIPNYDNPYKNEAAATSESKINHSEGGRGRNVNVQGENVSVSKSMRNPNNLKHVQGNSLQKKSTSNGRSGSNHMKSDKAKNATNPIKSKGNNQSSNGRKPSHTVKQNNATHERASANNAEKNKQTVSQQQKQTARNPYQHLNDQNKQKINQANNRNDRTNARSVRDSREGLLNKRSLLHDKDKR